MTQVRHSLLALLVATSLLAGNCGCATALFKAETWSGLLQKPDFIEHGTEQRVISKFSASLNENKETEFRRSISTRFENAALRAPDAFRDLDILKLPKGTLEVVESSIDEQGRCETVAKEKDGSVKYQFILIKDPAKGRWVVDDVMLRQQKKGTRSTKSAVELMDLLLTLREFLSTWEKGSREDVLNAVSSELADSLEQLPEPWRQHLTSQIVAEYSPDMARRPEVQMNDTDAVGKIPAKNGYFVVKVVQEQERWKVSDIEHRNSLRSKTADHHPGSILRQARAILAVTAFLDAYNQQNLEQLQLVTENRFYNSSLRIGDLSTIPLPQPDHAPENVQIQSFAGKLTVILPATSNIIRLDLQASETAATTTDEKQELANVESAFVVSDVTLYDQQNGKQRSLRAAFTAPARAMLFISALHEHDLPVLRQISSTQLNEGVWSRIDQDWLSEFPLESVPGGQLELVETSSTGAATELQFQSGTGLLCSVTMEDENGTLVVTDLQYPGADLAVSSLKTQLFVSVPIIDFARAWQNSDLDTVRKMTSSDFNRLVWGNLEQLPEHLSSLPQRLKRPVASVQQTPQTAVVSIGQDNATTVTLVREAGEWVIDEITCKTKNNTVLHIRKSLREDIAARFLNKPADGIQQAAWQSESVNSKTDGVVQAVGQTTSPPTRRRGNLSLPANHTQTTNTNTPTKPTTRSKTPAHKTPGLDLTEEPAPAKLPDEETTSEETTGEEPTTSHHESSGELHFGPGHTPKKQTSRKSPLPAEHPIDIPLE
jgi:hypothetical protein